MSRAIKLVRVDKNFETNILIFPLPLALLLITVPCSFDSFFDRVGQTNQLQQTCMH